MSTMIALSVALPRRTVLDCAWPCDFFFFLCCLPTWLRARLERRRAHLVSDQDGCVCLAMVGRHPTEGYVGGNRRAQSGPEDADFDPRGSCMESVVLRGRSWYPLAMLRSLSESAKSIRR